MSNEIFISYRRNDAKAEARAIFERLKATYGKNSVFMDVDGIGHGADFPEILEKRLQQAKILLAIVGPNWPGQAAVSSRIQLSDDFVRKEIEAALNRKIPVLPVLVNDASMPNIEELPETLSSFASINAAQIGYENFTSDLNKIETTIDNIIGSWRRVKKNIVLVLFIFILAGSGAHISVFKFLEGIDTPKGSFVQIGDFKVTPGEDNDLTWLRIKIERNFVDFFHDQTVSVDHRSLGSRLVGEPRKRIVGSVERNPNENIELRVRLLDKERLQAATSFEAPYDFWKKHYKSIPELMLYFLGVSPKNLGNRKTTKWPTKSFRAALLYFEAKRYAKAPQLERALRRLNKAIQEDPKFALAYWAKSQVLKEIGNKPEALAAAKMAQMIDPDHAKPHLVGSVINPLPALMSRVSTVKWKELKEGWQKKEVNLKDYDIKLLAWSFAEGKFEIKVGLSDLVTGSTVQNIRLQSGAAFAVNGGFFDIDKDSRLSPAGLLIVDNRMISPASEPRKGGSGVIFKKIDLIGIDFSKSFVVSSDVKAAIQVGPLVVDPGGKNGIRQNDYQRQNRSVVCIAEAEKLIVVVLTGGLSLYEMGHLLSEPVARGGFGCERALNLDGGPSTQVSFEINGNSTEVQGRWKINNALLIFPKE